MNEYSYRLMVQTSETPLSSWLGRSHWPKAQRSMWRRASQAYGQVLNAMFSAAQTNLDAQVVRLSARKVRPHSQLLRGPALAALLDYEEEVDPDIVVMTTHGRTGLARFALGSIADGMVCEGVAPVLLTPSHGGPSGSIGSALVPLDGSALAEVALTMVQTLAGKPLARVRLLRVTKDRAETPAARSYLTEKIVPRVSAWGLHVESHVEEGIAGLTIAAAAKDVDIVIMSTHGRGGFDRLRHGSVAQRVIRDMSVPVLLVRSKPD
ncbi:MAG: universal stress protein [Chloroflexi bacterium]|nr:universal stress protein [Chloroflexota bacterium]